jgi:hypothetical protein
LDNFSQPTGEFSVQTCGGGQKGGPIDYPIHYNNISENLQEVCQEFLKKTGKFQFFPPPGLLTGSGYHFAKEISPKSIDKRAASCYNILVK